MNQTTFVIIKPDAVEKGYVGRIIDIFERAGLAITFLHHKMAHGRFFWERFYSELKARVLKLQGDAITQDEFDEHIAFMSSGPIVTIGLNGPDAVRFVRDIVGSTNPQRAEPHTIRGMWGTDLPRNAIHASDTEQAALEEAAHFFAGALML